MDAVGAQCGARRMRLPGSQIHELIAPIGEEGQYFAL